MRKLSCCAITAENGITNSDTRVEGALWAVWEEHRTGRKGQPLHELHTRENDCVGSQSPRSHVSMHDAIRMQTGPRPPSHRRRVAAEMESGRVTACQLGKGGVGYALLTRCLAPIPSRLGRHAQGAAAVRSPSLLPPPSPFMPVKTRPLKMGIRSLLLPTTLAALRSGRRRAMARWRGGGRSTARVEGR